MTHSTVYLLPVRSYEEPSYILHFIDDKLICQGSESEWMDGWNHGFSRGAVLHEPIVCQLYDFEIANDNIIVRASELAVGGLKVLLSFYGRMERKYENKIGCAFFLAGLYLGCRPSL